MPSNHYSVHGGSAVITLSNPPVNAMGHAMRQELAAHLEAAWADPQVHSIVIIGAGKLFCGGADVKAFNTPASRAEPSSRTIVKQIEASAKPVIAAIHGSALGLGLEFAMGCHYRVAQRGAKLGLPEVKLGLLPGGGGTQRLPRLAGVEAALRMIVEGNSVTADEALKLGLVDEVAAQELLPAALAFAARMSARSEHPVASRRQAQAPAEAGWFDAQRDKLHKSKRGLPAPLECLACVEAAVNLPFDEGMKFERERFDVLVNGTESKALRHLFLAERAAAKIAGLAADTPVIPVRSVAVIGAGTMGGGIAMSFANAGIPVMLIEAAQEALDRGMATIAKNYDGTVAKGKLAREEADARLARITPTLEFERVADADLVIEAVFESMEVKKELFRKLDALCKADAILATNTSRLDVNEIAATTARPASVIGLHFFSPANVMRLVEVVRGQATAPSVIASSMAVSRQIGKLPVLVGVCDGFVGNRMVGQYAREAEFLLEEGASPQQVDAALQKFGLAMGRFAMSDLAGLDISWASRKRAAPTRPAHLRYSKVADRLCEMGRFGQKTGAGFYRYEAGSRTPIPDPIVQQVIEDCAREAGIERRVIDDAQIVERCIYALVNEGAKVLQEGIAQRSSDIDLIYVNGYGFPAWRGGPMFYADTVGVDKVYQRICDFHEKHGAFWTPAPLLKKLANEGRSFKELGDGARSA
ncbi:3-hydroxyacyl-CoA dehydrogenase [Alicycliphilus denitrificans]|uniref:3-hydroxybutyryl-CoA epimerase n=2 Tax=Alicycliphilus denitrificans TaxID=179636 RepID=F4GB70_ALIDK|nr:3-hydroxyacyl-CoA dehydrogenase NAD-binding domain-containing protein [Alicycliphilus denitrificans]ADV01012.1 3-hydroxyacyl-CoA dehydrogenase NAD-binding protein [Alicycliphilus denitrificans BC]AEB83561.1 3-hydroxybutyryl-CoA epimerase [Alicycliphilus denitrificans K601]QKD45165.1 3-hydroxyacyl-CoA dehydrogenase [Alicycliphilus denitrificans]GAO24605.1 3-hydroxybutyryl-CoA epimerase [Alicycliphilus sp. B1]